jgi:hypothetical protein
MSFCWVELFAGEVFVMELFWGFEVVLGGLFVIWLVVIEFVMLFVYDRLGFE